MTFATLGAMLCWSHCAQARPFRVAQVPNGPVASCLTCHLYPGGPRNAFGLTIESYGGVGFLVNGDVRWDAFALTDPSHPEQPPKTLAQIDSDGDGRTNGEELLDPAGSWRVGQSHPAPTTLVRSPGVTADALVVIRSVYASGGAAGAAYTHDYVVLFNRSTSTVSLSGWSLQYAPPNGTQVFGSGSANLTELPNLLLQPGQSYLVLEASSGAGGAVLPTPDLVDPSPIALAPSGGRLALVKQTASLGCNVFPSVCSEQQLSLLVDWVGYGTALTYEGVAPAPAPGVTQALTRAGGGCIDIDSNGADPSRSPPVLADFSAIEEAPRSAASPRAPCDGVAPPAVAVAVPTSNSGSLALLGALLALLGCSAALGRWRANAPAQQR